MMTRNSSEEKTKAQERQKKEIAKAYGKYVKAFTPRPKYVSNCLRAFVVGGAICAAALWFRNALQARGLSEEDAGTFVTITLVALAQLLTGLGVFDVIAKFAGAGVIVPTTGFASSLFSVAGPVLVCGISAATLVGVLYWLFR